jgi:hypothetical protein
MVTVSSVVVMGAAAAGSSSDITSISSVTPSAYIFGAGSTLGEVGVESRTTGAVSIIVSRSGTSESQYMLACDGRNVPAASIAEANPMIVRYRIVSPFAGQIEGSWYDADQI